MDCSHFRKIYFARAEESPESGLNEEAAKHLLECNECQEVAGTWKLTESLIRNEKEVTVNPFVATRIMQRIDTEFFSHDNRSVFKWKTLIQPALLTLAVISGLWIGWYSASRHTHANQEVASIAYSIESLRAGLYINEFTDEDNLLNLNN